MTSSVSVQISPSSALSLFVVIVYNVMTHYKNRAKAVSIPEGQNRKYHVGESEMLKIL